MKSNGKRITGSAHKRARKTVPWIIVNLIFASGIGLVAVALLLSLDMAGAWSSLWPLPRVSAVIIAAGGACLVLTLCFCKRRRPGQIYPLATMGASVAAIGLAISVLYVGFGWHLVPLGVRYLDLSNQGLRDIAQIRRLDKLESAVLSDNEITDPSPLASLKGLRYLDLTGNPIADFDAQALRVALPECLTLSRALDDRTTRVSLYGHPLPRQEALVEALGAYSALKVVDTRGAQLTADQISLLRQRFPAVTFLTITAPGGGDMSADDTSALIVVTSPEDAEDALARFPSLQKAALTGAAFTPGDYKSLTTRHPDVDITCQIKIYDHIWPSDAAFIDMSACHTDQNLLSDLAVFDRMTLLKLPELSPSEALAIIGALKGVDVTYLIGGTTISDETQTLDLRGRGVPEPEYLFALCQTAPNLTRVYIDDPDVEKRAALRDAGAGVELIYNMTLLGETCSTETREIDFGQRSVTDEEALQLDDALPYMPHLEKVSMYESRLSQETMDHLFDTYPDVFFGWTFYVGHGSWELRSDITAFSTLNTSRSTRRPTEEFRNLRFCKNLMALDLGHNAIDDISWLSAYPHMRILILADNKISDFSVLSELKELEYAELFINELPSFDCLANHDRLVDLNICYDMVVGTTSRDDITPLFTLTNLERLWIYHNGLNEDQLNQLREALPNTQIETPKESTGAGWRDHWRFRVMIDMFKARTYHEWME